MDLILYNGVIKTMVDHQTVSALAIENGLIVQVGNDEEILQLKKNGTQVIDLQGKPALPGFNDAHIHLLGYGVNKRRLNLAGSRSIAELVQRGKDYLAKYPTTEVLIGRGWNQDVFTARKSPTRADLDQISTELPIVFIRVCGHNLVINSRALQFYDIDEKTTAPPGGSIDFEAGTFYENAMDLIALPQPKGKEIKEILLEVMEDLAEKGITSVHSDDFGIGDYQQVISAYQELAAQGKMKVRVYQQCLFSDIDEVSGFLRTTGDWNSDSAYYRLGPIKLLADGSLGARTAYMSRPYHDDSATRGIACYTAEELEAIVLLCHQQRRAVAVHCIGDGMLQRLLDSVDNAQRCYPQITDVRHGVVHCQISTPAQLKKIAKLGMVAYVQPIFLDYDLHIVKDRVGESLANSSYAFKSLIDYGVVSALSTDCPVEPFDPFNNLYCAVSRKDLNGYPPDGFNPAQALSIHQAVKGYTVNGGYCSYEEQVKGRLLPGYYGDIVVLNRDIYRCEPKEVKNATVEMTIVGGKISYFRLKGLINP